MRTNLTEIHDDALMNLLPQVSSEDLNEGDLQCGNLAVHENARQVELHLETDIHLETKGDKCQQRKTYMHTNIISSQLIFEVTLALLMVGDHQRVKRRFGIWLRPDLCAFVSFFHFMDSSKPLAFSLKS